MPFLCRTRCNYVVTRIRLLQRSPSVLAYFAFSTCLRLVHQTCLLSLHALWQWPVGWGISAFATDNRLDWQTWPEEDPEREGLFVFRSGVSKPFQMFGFRNSANVVNRASEPSVRLFPSGREGCHTDGFRNRNHEDACMVAHNLVSELAAIIDRCDLLNERTNQSAEFPMGVVFCGTVRYFSRCHLLDLRETGEPRNEQDR